MQNLTITRDYEEAPGFVVVLLRVRQAHAIKWREFKAPAGATRAALLAEAERMALERWPGETSYRLALPMGDCGHG